MAYNPIDSKREEFRKYIEAAGVMDTFTRILTKLYESNSRPANPLEYVRDHFVDTSTIKVELETTQKQLQLANQKIESLNQQLKGLEQRSSQPAKRK